MSETSMQSLRDRLQKTTEQDTKAARNLMQAELKKLGNDLTTFSTNELTLTKKNMAGNFKTTRKFIQNQANLLASATDFSREVTALDRTRKTLTQIYLWIMGMALLLAGITGGGMYGLNLFWQNQLKTTLNQKAQAEKTLALIEQKTLGMEILNYEKKGSYVLFGPKYRMEKDSNGEVILYGQGREGILLKRR